MDHHKIVSEYAAEVRSQHASGHAREHAYRPALQRLMRSFPDVEAINDPKHSQHGAPDFIFQRLTNRDIILGYAEAKDIPASLDKVEKSEQMLRYAGYQNLFLTNYLEFRFYQNGDPYKTILIGRSHNDQITFDEEQFQRLGRELENFLALPAQEISSGVDLARIMGAKARRIRDDITSFLTEGEDPHTELNRMFQLMRTMLVHDLDHSKFADMYAQTLVYGLFVARYNDPNPDTFNREAARVFIPKTNPFLRHFFDHIAGPNFDARLARAVDELCEVFKVSDVKKLVHIHLASPSGRADKDPIIHFYEDFLSAYDPQLRKEMGAYYTPLPIAKYMVRQVDKLLKTRFDLKRGLADTARVTRNHRTYLNDLDTGRVTKRYKDERVTYDRVQILDPAVGTATFLNEVVNFIRSEFEGQEGLWPVYVEEHLIGRINGFELMMAPYTIAHLKLGMTLSTSGAENIQKRLRIFLTNTLEEGVPHQADLFSFGLAEAVTDESRAASQVKSERPIMVIIGNPPWRGISSNNTSFANSLVERYKVEPGGQVKLNERKNWLNDDYVKFLSFAEQLIESHGEGLVAMITNHGYLKNVTFRGMRWRLTQTFDEIYVLDLHGSYLMGETALSGLNDENIFGVKPGAAIIFGVKTGDGSKRSAARVFHSEVWGPKQHKFETLDRDDIDWVEVELDRKTYSFAPTPTDGKDSYDAGISLSDLFLVKSTGVLTMGDSFAVATEPELLLERLEAVKCGTGDATELKNQFKLGKNYAPWLLENINHIDPNLDCCLKYAYRPLDYRYIYYHPNTVWRMRDDTMKHLVRNEKNFGIVVCRQVTGEEFSHIFAFHHLVDDSFLSSASRERGYAVPAWLVQEDGSISPNLAPAALKALLANVTRMPSTEDIFAYVYGVLHSPNYRRRYAHFLTQDFPRVPIPENDAEFELFSMAGSRLLALHLMTGSAAGPLGITYPIAGSNRVEDIHYTNGTVQINDQQYFGGISAASWDFTIGNHRPAQKWLKERRGNQLTSDEIVQYQEIIFTLNSTVAIMAELAEGPWSEEDAADRS